MGHPVRINGQGIAEALETRSREPFIKDLARLMTLRPTDEAMREFVNKRPDRWVQMIAVWAKLAGFSDAAPRPQDGALRDIRELSDMELEQRLVGAQEQLESAQRGQRRTTRRLLPAPASRAR